MSQPVKTMIAYTHMMEFLPDRESLISGSFMCIDGLIYFFSPLFFVYISNDLNFMFLISFILNSVGLILFYSLKMPESLKFLLSQKWFGKFWEEFEKFQKIAKMSEEEIRDLKVIVAKYEGITKLNVPKKRSTGIIATLKA